MHILAAVAFIVAGLLFLIVGLASVWRDLLERDVLDSEDVDIDGTTPRSTEMPLDAVQSTERFADPRRIPGSQ